MTLSEMIAARQTAGAAYAAVVAVYVDAFVELHAYDMVLHPGVTSCFAKFQPATQHSEFLPDGIHGGYADRAMDRRVQLGNPTGE